MKKLFLILLCVCLFPVLAWSQTMVTANQITIAWDAVAPIATGDTIRYQVYTRSDLVSAGVKSGTEMTATSATVTFTVENKYYLGVQTVRYPTGVTTPVVSQIAWSTDPAVCQGGVTFGVLYYIAPSMIRNLRVGS